MANSFESWEIISKMLGKVMGIMGFFRENFVDTLFAEQCTLLKNSSILPVSQMFLTQSRLNTIRL